MRKYANLKDPNIQSALNDIAAKIAALETERAQLEEKKAACEKSCHKGALPGLLRAVLPGIGVGVGDSKHRQGGETDHNKPEKPKTPDKPPAPGTDVPPPGG